MFKIKQTAEFMRWFKSENQPVKSKVQVRIQKIQLDGHFGDFKSVGDGVSELRFSNGTRIYYTLRGNEVVFLLYGGDKSSQANDIKKAKALVASIDEVQK